MYEDVDELLAGDPSQVRGQHYDLVLNGVEIGGGSVRVHDAKMQEHIFRNILQVRTLCYTLSCDYLHTDPAYRY